MSTNGEFLTPYFDPYGHLHIVYNIAQAKFIWRMNAYPGVDACLKHFVTLISPISDKYCKYVAH